MERRKERERGARKHRGSKKREIPLGWSHGTARSSVQSRVAFTRAQPMGPEVWPASRSDHHRSGSVYKVGPMRRLEDRAVPTAQPSGTLIFFFASVRDECSVREWSTGERIGEGSSLLSVLHPSSSFLSTSPSLPNLRKLDGLENSRSISGSGQVGAGHVW